MSWAYLSFPIAIAARGFKVIYFYCLSVQFSSVAQSCPTPWSLWIAALQASLSITNSQSLLKLMSIESVMPSNVSSSVVPFSSHLQFSQHQGLFKWVNSLHQVAEVSVLPMNIQGLFPSGLTDSISLLFKELSRVFSNTTVQKHQFFSAQLSSQSNFHIHTWLLEKS